MADKICPIYSGEQQRTCLGEDCMMYVSHATSSGCGLVVEPQRTNSRIDTLQAQMQEMQVALIKLTNA